jgi:predicted ATPase
MHIERLRINGFRNLQNIEITFPHSGEDADGKPKAFKSHAVIGENGSGKSNLLEAIIAIFRALDLNVAAEFDYQVDYVCRGYKIEAKNWAGERTVAITELRTGEKRQHALSYLSRHSGKDSDFVDNRRKYLPSHVFAYYSGRNRRIEALFQDHQQRFYDALLSGSDDLMRRLFFCRAVHSQFVLLAYLINEDEESRRVLSNLNIRRLDSALFVLKRPYWFKPDMSEEVLTNGDNRFWFARGIVQEFLAELWKVSMAPIEDEERRLADFRGRTEDMSLLYMFVPNSESLLKLAGRIGEPSRFFKYLESTYISDLIDEVRIYVQHAHVDGDVSFGQLSEGEQQLLTVLGLMRFTREDESLFLLDEPDTHLNPIWKLRYFDEIDKVVRLQQASSTGDSQLIITTHDPIMVGSLRKEQVNILRRREGGVEVAKPDEHPEGMGIAGLLKSELFGLRSTVDIETRRRLDRRNYLFALGDRRSLSEEGELSRLSAQLSDLGFASDFKDPYFETFVKRMAVHRQFHKDVLSPDELKEQDRVADEIVSKILAEDGK